MKRIWLLLLLAILMITIVGCGGDDDDDDRKDSSNKKTSETSMQEDADAIYAILSSAETTWADPAYGLAYGETVFTVTIKSGKVVFDYTGGTESTREQDTEEWNRLANTENSEYSVKSKGLKSSIITFTGKEQGGRIVWTAIGDLDVLMGYNDNLSKILSDSKNSSNNGETPTPKSTLYSTPVYEVKKRNIDEIQYEYTAYIYGPAYSASYAMYNQEFGAIAGFYTDGDSLDGRKFEKFNIELAGIDIAKDYPVDSEELTKSVYSFLYDKYDSTYSGKSSTFYLHICDDGHMHGISQNSYTGIVYDEEGVSVQEWLLSAGLARAVHDKGTDEWDEYYAALEKGAREQKRGVWADGFEPEWARESEEYKFVCEKGYSAWINRPIPTEPVKDYQVPNGGLNEYQFVKINSRKEGEELEKRLLDDGYILFSRDTVPESEWKLVVSTKQVQLGFELYLDEEEWPPESVKIYVFEKSYRRALWELENYGYVDNDLLQECIQGDVIINYLPFDAREKAGTQTFEFNEQVKDQMATWLQITSPIDVEIKIKDVYSLQYYIFYIAGNQPFLIKMPNGSYNVVEINGISIPRDECYICLTLDEHHNESTPKEVDLKSLCDKYHIQNGDITGKPNYSLLGGPSQY